MMRDREDHARKLMPGFTPLGIWSFSIGTSIGWGSFIVTCNSFLQKSGVLGTVLGLLAGMTVILIITWNLQYMIQKKPDAGGVYTFEKQMGGRDLGFLSFWFILLTYLAILWANITSVPLFARFFLGDLFRFGFHYSIFGYEVWLGEVVLSVCAVVLTGFFLARAKPGVPNRVMIFSALLFSAGFTVCAVIALAGHDAAFSYEPLFMEHSSAFGQILRTAAISPWAFIGFENIAHFSEEYTFPVRKVRPILISSVVVSTVLYLFVTLLSVSAYPPEYDSWLSYIRDMGNLEGIQAVPAFYAANHYLGSAGVAILMFSLFAVILTSLIGNMMALSRLLYAAGREGEAPGFLGKLDRNRNPERAIMTVVGLSLLIPFIGRTAIGWIVDVTTLGSTLIYAAISYAVFRYARQAGDRLESGTGMAGIVLMAFFLALLLIPGLLPFHAMETESYALFIVWALLGLACFRWILKKDPGQTNRQRIIVWGILLVLMLFASMMWVSRATEQAANQAIERIFEYHQGHPGATSGTEERITFLQSQADRISRTNTLYAMVSIGVFILSMSIILNNIRENRWLSERLSTAEEEARTAQKIAELKESISALLDNMPCLSASKDAETGVYLACNQAFAEYAHKESPEGVVGLRDTELFDAETAWHFIEDDRVTLSMDQPYIFYEDVLDATGHRRQFQTTKLKYRDESGRLCTLGMSQDVTEMVRIQRENATTREAYERARSMGLIYTHLAQALAASYIDVFYVNLESGEFVEYSSEAGDGQLAERRRGPHFFDTCRVEAEAFVHPEDRAMFVHALERETLLETLNRGQSSLISYRLLFEGAYRYVNLRASRMADDERFVILGVMDVDEQTRQRQAAERVREEHIAYECLNVLAGTFLSVYLVKPESGAYREYSTEEGTELFGIPETGEDFFATLREKGREFIDPEDVPRFLSLFTRENVLADVSRGGTYVLSLRFVVRGTPTYCQIKAGRVVEKDGTHLVIGFNNIDANVRREEEYARRLAQAQDKASLDALTGVRNRYAYLDAEKEMNLRIAQHTQPGFTVTVLDVNDLKNINDTQGHQAGDAYIRSACTLVCNIFKHSPVFRIGGDEFAVISQGTDCACIDELIGQVREHNAEALRSGGIVIACGMSRFESDAKVGDVFKRADRNMYENKKALKERATDRA
ncbi:MAG: amino acid permease [Clostridia bacterium]|nr:amino acid permease [Clostridia bacterium]